MSTNPVFTDGCTLTNSPASRYLSVTTASYVAGKGRFGGPGLQLGNSGAKANISFPNNPVTGVTSFAFQYDTAPSSPLQIWNAQDINAAVTQCHLDILPTQQLQFFRGATAIGSPSTQTFPINTITQLQVKVTIDPASGLVECRLNGQTSPIITFTGNTRNGANSFFSVLGLGVIGNSQGNVWYSDIIAFDSGGSAPNDYLGNKRVYTVAPVGDSATGGLNAFTPTPAQSAGSHYKNIIIQPPPGDADYLATAATSARESFALGALPAGATGVSGLNIVASWRIDDAGPHTAEISSRSNSVDSFSAAVNVPASYAFSTFFQATDPNTGVAWLAANVGGSEIGVELIS